MTLPVRHVPPPPQPWDEQGCVICRSRWMGGSSPEPQLLGESVPPGDRIYRCGVCGAYWREGWENPREVSLEQALADVPDLRERQGKLGLD